MIGAVCNFRGCSKSSVNIFSVTGAILKDQDCMALLTLASVPLTFMALPEPVMVEEADEEPTPK